MIALLAAVVSVALVALIAVAAFAATPSLLAVAVGVAVLALALGWGTLLDLPARRGTSVVIIITGGGGAALSVLAADRARPLALYAAVLALAVLIAFGHEMLRRPPRPQLVESLTGTVSGQILALLGSGWAMLPAIRPGLTGVVAVAAAVAATRVASLIPLVARTGGWASVLFGTVAGAAAGIALEPVRAVPVAVAAFVVSGVVAGLDRLLAPLPTRRVATAMISAAAAPVVAVGTVAYAVLRLVA